jgi:GTP-binding protein HflX
MGLGAYEADVYRDAIKLQVQTIRKKLTHIRGKRVLQRERRTELGFLTVSLAGYTSSGKSTLFNALTQETALVDKMLFTTLSTQTRMIEFSNRKFLLTDTVGFIDRLPLSLIEAFRSTLEETIFADLIILVVDFAEPLATIERKVRVCTETIDQLGASGIPMVTALNKMDLLKPDEREQRLEELKDKIRNPIMLSAKCETNLDALRKHILKVLENYQAAQFSVPLTGNVMPFISWLHQKADIHTEEFTNTSVNVDFEANSQVTEQVRRKVQDLNGKFQLKTSTTPSSK